MRRASISKALRLSGRTVAPASQKRIVTHVRRRYAAVWRCAAEIIGHIHQPLLDCGIERRQRGSVEGDPAIRQARGDPAWLQGVRVKEGGAVTLIVEADPSNMDEAEARRAEAEARAMNVKGVTEAKAMLTAERQPGQHEHQHQHAETPPRPGQQRVRKGARIIDAEALEAWSGEDIASYLPPRDLPTPTADPEVTNPLCRLPMNGINRGQNDIYAWNLMDGTILTKAWPNGDLVAWRPGDEGLGQILERAGLPLSERMKFQSGGALPVKAS